METRAHHVVIGAFVAAAIFLAFMLIIWLGRYEFGRQEAYYAIYFDEAVSGLSVSGEVRYQGILIGEVFAITVDPDQPQRVRVVVRLRLRDDIQLRTDTVASLEYQGVTGVSFVQLSGGKKESDLLPVVSDPAADLPVISSRLSDINILVGGMPRMLQTVEETLRELRHFMSPENVENISGILSDIRTVTRQFAEREREIDQMIANAAEFSGELKDGMAELRVAARALTRAADQVSSAVDEELPAAIYEVRMTAQSFANAAQTADRMLAESEPAITQFTTQGLGQFAILVAESRQLVRTLDRIALRLEENPAGFVLGSEERGSEHTPSGNR
jgi:phospholipid/cholesterol/gamma-HCH transport system substrate-binding protein